MNIPIVYEDENLLVINKPAGLVAHPKLINDTQESVTSWFSKKYPKSINVGDDPLRPGLVHRLDKYTSGLLILAKTQKDFEFIKNLFKKRDINKKYFTLVYGVPKDKEGIIDLPLGKIGIKQTTRITGKKDLEEKEALTAWKIKKAWNDFSLLEVSPKTGRTHQIRIHLNSIGHPIVGDLIYGNKKNKNSELKLNRLFLHAYSLEFQSPSGRMLRVDADLPEELSDFIAKIPNS